jgi:hypothetical protein
MPIPAATHFVFVDFENVQEVDLEAIRDQPVHVTLLVGKNQRKIDLQLAKQLMEFAAQVRIIEVGASGRNALDLTLACYLGRSIERSQGGSFGIVSKDKDFAPMISHLQALDVKIVQTDTFAALPFVRARKTPASTKQTTSASPASAQKRAVVDRRAKVIARLQDPANRNWPGDEAALRSNIKTTLGKETSEAKVSDIIRELRESGAVTINSSGEVRYSAKR